MPIHIIAKVATEGPSSIPFGWAIIKAAPVLAVLYLLKWYFNGATNGSERNMHSKVVMVTGGTAGIGAEVVKGLAQRGAQIVLLVRQPLSDPFLVDYIEDLRSQTNNELITAENVDLESFHSIRLFATKWVDNAPPRRLDMIVLCANTMTPPGGKATMTEDGLEATWGLNYLANFHLLSILSPALRAQPPDRDVRIIIGTCAAYVGGKLPNLDSKSSATKSKKDAKTEPEQIGFTPAAVYATSKLALMTFAVAFQKHLSNYARPDKQPMNARVIIVDPGWTRTPGMRRFLTFGSLWGLALYLITWPLWWLVLKSGDQGAQTFLYAAMEAQWGRGEGGYFLKECTRFKWTRKEIDDEVLQKKLWESSGKTIEVLEKESAKRRAVEKKEAEKSAGKTTAKDANGEAKQRKGK
ncbi:oxidoreductase-like protein [Cucurbitaria berberidis CBS 394.84]|uniref:Oxidoreductase-like protein n=1 Tax=Cucurbitaria berberidis CBS 394.84 TaxID=1168544 RepID=A0A9P4L426_9PLEO|nr:oxidoreductase-like protein [Cucurbitaria berberidis CBS 394.84]KAF1840904.1 oxidoreductase-like protein [Cucurbitaria berberidis CBS 394.84]